MVYLIKNSNDSLLEIVALSQDGPELVFRIAGGLIWGGANFFYKFDI